LPEWKTQNITFLEGSTVEESNEKGMKMKKSTWAWMGLGLAVLVLLVAGLVKFGGSGKAFATPAEIQAGEMSATLLAERIQSQPVDAILLDVRQPDEYASGHIEGAKSLPLSEIESRLAELDKDQVYVVICRSGNRSARAASLLRNGGFTKVLNMTGGMNSWSGAVVP
jgi:rhodanese-related sulfurtransferase